MSELAKEKLYRKELIEAGATGDNNVARIRSLAGGGGGTEAEFLALKNIFETDFNLVIESSDNLDDLIVEVNSYFDTTKVIAIGSTLNVTAFKNVLQKYLGTLDIELGDSGSVELYLQNEEGENISVAIFNDETEISNNTIVVVGGSNYSLGQQAELLITPPITNLEDILENQTVIDYLNSGVLTYTGPETSDGLQIFYTSLSCYASNLEIEEKRAKPSDILSMFNAPSANVE